jgi:hypothetical protein
MGQTLASTTYGPFWSGCQAALNAIQIEVHVHNATKTKEHRRRVEEASKEAKDRGDQECGMVEG